MKTNTPIQLFNENQHLFSISGVYYKFIAILKPQQLMSKKEKEIVKVVLKNQNSILESKI